MTYDKVPRKERFITGNDAVFLARHGMNILATDLSAKMLEFVIHSGSVADSPQAPPAAVI